MRYFLTTLRGRLLITILLASIPIFLLLIYMGMEQRTRAVYRVQDEAAQLARITASREAEMISNAESFLLLLANLPDLRNGSTAGCTDLLTAIVTDHYKYYASFWVADLEGHVVCSPPGKHTPHDFDTCEHYTNLINSPNDDFVFSGYHICEHTGKAVLSIGLPISSYTGQRVLVSSIILDLAWISDFAAEAGLPEGSELTIIDHGGIILSHYPDNDPWIGKALPANTDLSSLAAAGEGTLVGQDLHGTPSILAVSPLSKSNKDIILIFSQPTSLAFAEADRNLLSNIIILALGLLSSLWLMWVTSRSRILTPIERLVNITQKVAEGDLSARSGLDPTQGELGKLAHSFDQMAEKLNADEMERARHLAELSEYALNLEDSNRELSDFVNIAAHDLREPLRKIITFNDLLQARHSPQLTAEGTRYIQRIQETALRMLTLLDDLRTFSRVTLKARVYESVDLNQVANQVVQDQDLAIRESEALIIISELPVVEADRTQMTQLLANLVSNALKFHPPGVPPVVRIQSVNPSGSAPPNGFCEFQVQDEGVGFDSRYMDRLFEPFERLHPREAFDGTGLGLAICRKIVIHHGGEIHAESTPGQGATFTVRLPRQQPKEKVEVQHE